MTVWIDKKFLNNISVQLEQFKWKDNNLANCRCPVCGDSQKNKYKARMYFFERKGSYFVHCHNCGYSKSFKNFLKRLDGKIYSEYCMETFKESSNSASKSTGKKAPGLYYKSPEFKNPTKVTLLDGILQRLDTLPDDNLAIQYALGRHIPRGKFGQLYYIDDISKLKRVFPKYKDRIHGTEPRLVMPFFTQKGHLFAISCRALGDEELRYLTLSVGSWPDQVPMVYGLNTLDIEKHIYVVEGPIDSLFLPNCIAVGGSDLKKIERVLPKEKCTLIFDNQNRNKDVIKIMQHSIENHFKVCIWPDTVGKKDVNEMILSGMDSKSVIDIIHANTFSGLDAVNRLNAWKKC